MNPFLSVRTRLFALCVGLLLVMGGANLLLGQINSQHEEQVHLQQEQYRRVNVIYSVQQGLSTFRFWQGQLNAAMLVENKVGEVQTQERLEQARQDLNERLKDLEVFDPDTGAVIRKAVGELSKVMYDGVVALVKKDPAAESLMADASRILNTFERALAAAIERERRLAEDVERAALERADSSLRISIAIIVASTTFGLLLTYLVVRSIIRPMQSTVIALRQVNAGETTIDLPPVRQDEFGDMAVALRQFRDQAEHLRHLAYRDPLTGIGNRAYLEEHLRQAIQTCKQDGTRVAVLYIDLDNFRSVNDSLGHSAGDRYLSEAVLRLQRFVPDDVLVCRYSGDKFAVLLQGIPDWDTDTLQAHLREVASNVLRGMAEPFQLGGDMLPMSVSIGIAVSPGDGESGEQLISSADAAMYLAKRSGRNNAKFASPELTSDARKQLVLITDIRRGLEDGEFEPFYQPIVDVSAGRVTCAEALLRWRHPQRGVVLAGEFIPAAEDSGLIHALGERCIIKACEQAQSWVNGNADPIRISVNLSARQIEDRTAIAMLDRLHRNGGHGAKGLDFEITESAILQQVDRAQETLAQIRALGHKLSVDDFGTGYSSMVYLQRFPISRIKIDRSFVSRMETSREAHAIVSATIALARSLDLEVVAEGVETVSQAQQLQALGCTLQQGYYFTPALPAQEFEAWCTTQAGRFASAA